MRWVAGASSSGALIGTIYGLIRPDPFDSRLLWLAGIALIGILATWWSTETQVACRDDIIAAMPKPRALVRATIEEMEEQAAREAGLPHIADGSRQR